MNLVRTIAAKSLLRRPGRTFFAILGIAAGIATVVCVFTLDHSTILGLSEPSKPNWKADVEVSPSVKVDNPRRELEKLPGVAAVTAFFQNDVEISAGDAVEAPRQRVRLFGIEADSAPNVDLYRVVAGDDLKYRDRDREVLVGESLAETLSLKPGSTIRLARPSRGARSVCIDGVMQTIESKDEAAAPPTAFRVAGILAKEKLGHRAGGAVVVVEYETGRGLYQGQQIADRYLVKKDPEVDVERFKQSLGEAYSFDMDQRIVVGQAADERAFRNGVRIAGLLALVLGLFVIFHTLSIALVERLREIAVLDALGASRRQIVRIFLVEAIVLAGTGAALGLGGGIGLAWALLAKGVTTLGLGKRVQVFEVPWETVAPLAAFGAGIALLGSIFPLLRIRNADSSGILRGDASTRAEPAARSFRLWSALLIAVILPLGYFTVAPVVGEFRTQMAGTLLVGLAILGLLIGLPLVVPGALARVAAALAAPFRRAWPLAGRLAAKSVRETPARIAVAAVGIAMVAAGFVALKGMTRSLRQEIDIWANEAAVDKIFIRDIDDRPFADVALALKKHPAVIGVERADARAYAPFLIVGVDADELAAYGPCRDNAVALDALREGRGMVVTRRLALDMNYAVGSSVFVPGGSGKVQEFKVVAVADHYGYSPYPDERLYGVVAEAAMQRLFCIDMSKTSRVAVRLAGGANDAAALYELKRHCLENVASASSWKFESGIRVRDYLMRDVDRDLTLFDIIIGLTAVLAGLGVLNGQLLAALERTKEYGILKALGASNGQIAGTALLENLVVGVVGGAIGTLLGLAMTPIVIAAVEQISALPLPQTTAGNLIPFAFGGAVVLALLAGLYPAWRINRMSAAAAVRTGG